VNPDPATLATDLAKTRRSLHAVAELVLAGPQYRRSGTIRLRVTPGGLATVTDPEVRVDGVRLVTGDQQWSIAGHSCAELAEAIGRPLSSLKDVYHDATDVSEVEPLDVQRAAAAWLMRCWVAGDEALRRLAPTETPVVWPEHFDVAIRLDDVNYGVSPGDIHIDEPYAYVGPPTKRTGAFWNQPFGAARTMRELGGADPVQVLAFFTEGRRNA
jgi:hypothetical protein